MSAFQPSTETLEKWVYTRKGINQIGNFNHPGIFSTVGINTDRSLFFIAIVIEILCVALATFMSGFNIIFVATALGLFAVDLILAFMMHIRKQNNICKNNCEFEIANYEINKKLKDSKGKKDAAEASIDVIHRKQRFFKFGIFLSAIVKIFGFFIINYFGIGILVFVSILFLFAAYIHIFHTGYYRSYYRFAKSWKIDYGRYLAAVKRDDATSDFVVRSYGEHKLENIPSDIKTELSTSFNKIKNDETRKINKHNNSNLINSSTQTFVVFGDDNRLKLVHSGDEDEFYLWTWGTVEDRDLISLITGHGMSDSLKAYMAYETLKKQYYYSTVQKADHQDIKQ